VKFEISGVQEQDLTTLVELIRELARFEKLEHEVKATVHSLGQALLGPHPAAGALLGRCDGEVVGYAIYFFTFSSFVGRAGIWLDDIYVKPGFRSHGLGRALLTAVAKVGAERNCGRFEWTALKWNQHALDLYARLGARVMDDWLLLRLDEGGLRQVAASEQ
jgi:GNAT superfamily N-acetyltransferase